MSRIFLFGLMFLLVIGCKKEEPNTPPVAFFTITPESGSIDSLFVFDASASGDMEDEDSLLQIRWDFESDSVWDTEFSINRIVTHKFTKEGRYYVKMEIKDQEGLSEFMSKELIVSINNFPPLEPSSPFPADGSEGKGDRVRFVWQCSDPDGDSLRYDLYFGTVSPPPLYMANYSTNEFYKYLANVEDVYYWRIVAEDSLSQTSSPIWSFKHLEDVHNPDAPYPASEPYPRSGQILTSPEVVLSWKCKHDNEYRTWHIMSKIYVGYSPYKMDLVNEQQERSFLLEGLMGGRDVYWRIDASVDGYTTIGDVWKFSTIANFPPTAADNTNPKPGSLLSKVPEVWTWEAHDPENDQLSYDVWFGKSSDFRLLHSGLQSSSMPAPSGLDKDSHYQWRIDVLDENGNRTLGQLMFLHTTSAHPLRRINYYKSDTLYDQTNFTYDEFGRMISNIRDGFTFYNYKYPWIRKDSIFFEYDEFSRVKRMHGRIKSTGGNGWVFHDNLFDLDHFWENDTICWRRKENGSIQDIIVYDGCGRITHFYQRKMEDNPRMIAEYLGSYRPVNLKYVYIQDASGGYGENWDQTMDYDDHPNPYFQIPFLHYYSLDWRVKGAPTEFANNMTRIYRERTRRGYIEIEYEYEYDSNGYVSKKWEKGKKAAEYWEFIYE